MRTALTAPAAHRLCAVACPGQVFPTLVLGGNRPAWHAYPTRQLSAGKFCTRGAVRCQAASTSDGSEESKEAALERRLRESARVEERVNVIFSREDFDRQLKAAGDQLVVLEVESSHVCQTGLEEEPELQWKADQSAALAPCANIKHVLQRTARDCSDVTFLTLEADTDEGQALCDELGVEVLPTLQFWRSGQKLWEHRGVLHLEQDLGEGVLYYGDQAANGVRASQFVTELRSRADFDSFISSQDDKVLTVVNVALTSATPCVRVFAAVMALAKNFQGYAAFARLLGDESAEAQELMRELKIQQVPTFLFYRGGQPAGRHVGSSRGDLIGKILQQQAALGIAPPAPKAAPAKPRRRKAAAST